MKKVLSALLFFPCLYANAQWNTNPAIDNAICVQPFEQMNVKHISDLKGGAIIVWEDYRNDPTNTFGDIYAQRINANGNVMWTLNGIAICNDAAHQAAPTLVSDSSGGAIIVWQDSRGSKRNLYAQRVDSSGAIQWTSNGIAVTARNYDQKNPKVLTDGAHGAVVLWQDSIGNVDYDIYAQHLNASGIPQWTNGLGIATGLGSQVNVKAQIDATLNVFATWQDKRNGSDYDIYVQKFGMAGTTQWTSNGVVLCNFAGTQSGPKIALDNTGGVIVLWQDKRNGSDYDVYAQRVNSSGAVQWTTGGRAVCVAAGNQTAVDLTTKNISNGAIFGWKDARNGTNNIDIYGQMLDLTGAPQWSANGIAIANGTANQLNVNITSDGAGGAIVAYQDSSAGNWDIKSQRVSAAGTLLWAAGGVSVGTAALDQTGPNVTLENGGTSIYTFLDMRNASDNDIYAYKLDINGQAVSVRSLQEETSSLLVYPNPSQGDVQFKLKGSSIDQIRIYDISGAELLLDKSDTDLYTLKRSLPAGMYFYTLYADQKNINGKFVIEK